MKPFKLMLLTLLLLPLMAPAQGEPDETYSITVIGGAASIENEPVEEAEEGVTVTIAANSAETGKRFKNWTIDVEEAEFANDTAAETTFEMPAEDVVITANYEDIFYSITMLSSDSGTVSANPADSAIMGTEITLTATPNTGYDFKEWVVTEGGVAIADNKFTMPASDVEIKAIFELKSYSVVVTIVPDSCGTVTGNGKYTHGNSVTLTATTESHCNFLGWVADQDETPLSTYSTYTFYATEDIALAAKFEKKLIISEPQPYIITSAGSAFTVTKANMYGEPQTLGTYTAAQSAINGIKGFANGNTCEIQFGENGELLDIGQNVINFDGVSPGWNAILSGKIKSTAPSSTGTIALSNGANVESKADISNTVGNGIYNGNATAGTLTISGGTIEVTATNVNAVYNYASGTIIISGGTISATTGNAVNNRQNGKITVSGGSITSANITNGTINNVSSGTLEIKGSAIANTAGGNAVYNASAGAISLDSNPTITGSIYKAGTGNLNILEDFNPQSGKVYTLDFSSYSENSTAVLNGKNYAAKFALANRDWSLKTDDDNLVMTYTGPNYRYTITGSSASFIVSKSSAISTGATIASGVAIQAAIDSIKADADGEECEIQFGDGATELNIGSYSVTFNGSGIGWGAVTLTGKITSSSTTISLSNGASIESKADIRSTSNYAIYNSGTGTLTISGGTISAANYAVYNSSTGIVNIEGGNISATGISAYAVYNYSGGTINISGGTIKATTGSAVYNYNYYSGGTINISGGTVETTTGYAIYNQNIGKITVSGNAYVISANTDASQGTIYIGTSADTTVLEITGGTIANTANGNAIYNASTASIALGGNPAITGNIKRAGAGNLSFLANFAPGSRTYTLVPPYYSEGAIAVENGKNFLANFKLANEEWGLKISDNNLAMTYIGVPKLYVITGSGTSFTATKNGTQVGTTAAIQTVINAIKSDANGAPCEIQFGNLATELSIGSANITFDGGASGLAAGLEWGAISLSGKVTSSSASVNGTIYLSNGASVESKADIKNTYTYDSYAIRNNSTGTLTISGGTVSAASTITTAGYSAYAIYNGAGGAVNITGGTVSATASNSNPAYAVYSEFGSVALGGSPAITGTIKTSSGKLSVIEGFTPNGFYTVDLFSYPTDAIAVANGKGFRMYFPFANDDWELEENNDDLAIAYIGAPKHYVINTNGSYFTATKDGATVGTANTTILNVIGYIKSDANGAPCEIQFGSGATELSIGSNNITFDGASPGWNTTLSGKITSSSTTSTISLSNGASVESKADIKNTYTYDSYAIRNSGAGTLTISGGTVSAASSYSSASYAAYAIYNGAGGVVNITGGAIEASAYYSAYAVYNYSGGTVNITGGAIKDSVYYNTYNSYSAYNASSGKITVSGSANITSGRTAVYNASSGVIEITGGIITSPADSNAVYNASSGSIALGGAPTITGNIKIAGTGNLSVLASFVPGEKTYTIALPSYLGGEIAVANGENFTANFALANDNYGLIIDNSNLVVGVWSFSYAKDTTGAYTISKVGATESVAIQTIIDNIKADAAGEPCEIQFGNGEEELDIDAESITFSGVSPGWDVILSGKITSSNATSTISLSNGASVESKADIANTDAGVAIRNIGAGTLTISDGTIEAASSAVANASSGAVVLRGAPTIIGNISKLGTGNLSVAEGAPAFAPDSKIYTLLFPSYLEGTTAVLNGEGFAANFALANSDWGFAADSSGNLAMTYTGPNYRYTITSNDSSSFMVTKSTATTETPLTFPAPRNITVAMQDSYGDGWNSAYLRISVNGTYLSTNPTISSGSSNTYTFNANQGDAIAVYWYKGSYDNECSFNIYYTDAPSTILVSRSNLSSVSGGTQLGSFTVVSTITVVSTTSIQTAIDAIKADANGEESELRFGNGTAPLALGSAYINFDGAAPGWDVTLTGKITSSNSTSTISLSNGANIESKADIANTYGGAYAIRNNGTGTLTISGGTIDSTVYNASTGTISITGGTISANNYAVNNASSGSVALGGSPTITGSIYNAGAGNLSVLDSFAPGSKIYTLAFPSYSEGATAVLNGDGFAANFALANSDWGFAADSSGNLAMTYIGVPKLYVITNNSDYFALTKDSSTTSYTAIQGVINAIKSDVSGAPCEIQFGNGTDELALGTANITFDGGYYGADWGQITLSGKITSSNTTGTISLSNGANVESKADIANTYNDYGANAIRNNSTGTLTISGGMIEAIYYAVNNTSSGAVVLGGSPAITGGIYKAGTGNLSVIAEGDNKFAPGSKIYTLDFASYATGVAVLNGKDFLANFALANVSSYGLTISGNNLAIMSAAELCEADGKVWENYSCRVYAIAPIITEQPMEGAMAAGGEYTLSVAAVAPDGGALSYQWYSVDLYGNDSEIKGATSATYAVSESRKGEYYYYAMVTNTIADNGDYGQKTATAASNIVMLNVNENTPILPQIASGNIRAYAANGNIVLENLPSDAKVEVYSLQGKRVYSAVWAKNLLPLHSMQIPIQTKGLYIVKVGKTSFRVAVK